MTMKQQALRFNRMIDIHTYKYHKPVNWHKSEDNDPVKKFPRNPLVTQNKS